ncbi:MAG TPA: acyl-CoA thioesterase [Clostridiaceae bacterium]|nr:acyl-CoA thioesterase [Clostridiaceae bacterium]
MEMKRISDSKIEMRELVLPNDTNILGNLLGGRLLHWVDIAGAMAASTHAQSVVATAAIDSVEFNEPVHVGEIVILKAHLTWVGRTSMEVLVEVCSENYLTGVIKATNRAYVTYVAVDQNGKPKPVPGLILETEEERTEFEEAKKRREVRLAKRKASKETKCI